MSDRNYNDLIISSSVSLLYAIKRMDEIKRKLLVVFKDDKFYSLVSIGDIQRTILAGKDLANTAVADTVKDKELFLCYESDSIAHIKKEMLAIRCEFMPILDSAGNLKKVYFWEDFFAGDIVDKEQSSSLANVPVVIMAGGEGRRLRPITNILPKPLIPFREKAIVQVIMERFRRFGATKFTMSVNYRAEMIRFYFDSLKEKDYTVDYIMEDKPLGTAGSLHLAKDKIHSTFFLSNCDIVINHNYSEILDYHKKHKNLITAVAALKIYEIPYGTFEVSADGCFESIVEKPELSYMINTGMYILEPNVFDYINEGEFLHITDLMEKVHSQGKRVGIYPINASSWIDVGTWKEYNKISNIF